MTLLETVELLVLVSLPVLLLGRTSSFGSGWSALARHATVPVGEQRVTLPRRPESDEWTAKPVGYRDMHFGPPERKDAVSIDPSRDRGPDVRVLPGNRSLAIRIRTGKARWTVVRVDAARERDEVVVRALARRSGGEGEDWEAGLARTLEPLLDALLREITGIQPATKRRGARGDEER